MPFRFFSLLLVCLGLFSCGITSAEDPVIPRKPTATPMVEDDGDPLLLDGSKSASYSLLRRLYLEADTEVYHLRVKILPSSATSLLRQTEPAGGSVFGVGGYVSGSYSGEEIQGKGILRVQVLESDSDLAPVDSVIILKVIDSKSVALLPGDIVHFNCRREEEVIGPVLANQVPADRKAISTWELDGCRMPSPRVESSE